MHKDTSKSSKYILPFILPLLIFLICLILNSNKPTIINYYVSVNGNDNNIGSLISPFKSIEKAKNVIAQEDINSIKNTTFCIYIKEGTYNFNKTLCFLDNLNLNNNQIILKAYKSDIVYFSGSETLLYKNFSPLDYNYISKNLINKDFINDILVYDISSYDLNFNISKDSILLAPELVINNNPMCLSRYPNYSFLTTGKINTIDTFVCNDNRLRRWVKNETVFMNGYWKYDWADQTIRLSNFNKENNIIKISDPLEYGLKSNQRFYFTNILSELDSMDEYYIDYEKKILYLIPPLDFYNSKIKLSLLNEPIIKIHNSNNISFENIIFEDGRNSAFNIIDSNNISIKNCVIRNFSNTGIVIDNGINNLISHCKIYNLGFGGIYIYGGDRNTLSSCKHIIEYNCIYNYSRLKRTFTPAIDANGVGINISHNIIHDAPHSGIIFSGNDHIIEYNEIFDIAKETDDVGAIYAGRDWTSRGNIIRYNNIHDIEYNSGKELVAGVYLDDCMSSAEVYNNLFARVGLAIMGGGGRDNIFKNNKIYDCNSSIVFDDRGIRWANISEIIENTNRVPYSSELWIKKYPKIKSLINNSNPGVPFGNEIVGNKIINSPYPNISDSVIENGSVTLN